MNSETGNEFEAEYHDRVRKIRKGAAMALKELDQLRSAGPIPQEALDAEVARIAEEAAPVRMPSRCFIGWVMASRDS